MCNPERCAARAAASEAGEAPLHARALPHIDRPSGGFARAGDMAGGGERAPVEGGVDVEGLFMLCAAPDADAAAELGGGAFPTMSRDETTSIGTTTCTRRSPTSRLQA